MNFSPSQSVILNKLGSSLTFTQHMRKLFTSLVTSNMSTLERPTRFPTWVIAVAPQFFFSLWLKQESNGFSGVLYQTTWLLCQFTQNESHGISRTCNVQCDPASYFSSGLSSWPHLLRPFPYSLYSAYLDHKSSSLRHLNELFWWQSVPWPSSLCQVFCIIFPRAHSSLFVFLFFCSFGACLGTR